MFEHFEKLVKPCRTFEDLLKKLPNKRLPKASNLVILSTIWSKIFKTCLKLFELFFSAEVQWTAFKNIYSPERELSGCSYSFVYFFSAALWRAWFWQKNVKFKLIIEGTLSIFVQHRLKTSIVSNWLSLAVLSRMF